MNSSREYVAEEKIKHISNFMPSAFIPEEANVAFIGKRQSSGFVRVGCHDAVGSDTMS